MISITKSRFTKRAQATSITRTESEDLGRRAGAKTKTRNKVSGKMESTSGLNVSLPNTQIGSAPITIDTDPMLVGLMTNNTNILYALYRDIYYNDPVGGSAVDLLSQLPFGDFSLGGIENDKILRVYNENVERLGCKTLIPEMSVDYLVLGMHCHSLLYDRSKKMFVDVMPYAPENITVQTLPFYSQEPIINATFSEQHKRVLQGTSPRLQRLKKLVGSEVFEKISRGSVELEPLSTTYIPRKTFSDTDMGVSYYRRLLPLYLIEKNLYRGTLVESARRQRGIMHLTMGDGDNWIPNPADMEFMVDLFMNADIDPLGGIVATRMGVNVEEIRQGGDFWKVTDFSDSVLSQKLRALSISEAFLSGDANYNVNDNSMTVFIETMRSYREMMTRKFFYEKIFPLVSMINGYAINTKGKIITNERLMDQMDPEEALYAMNDGSRLLIPSVSWSKQLKPEGDQAYMDMLTAMSEKGVPVPLRVMAAAGGLNLDELLKQQDDDLSIRKKMQEYSAKIEALRPKESAEEEGGDDLEDEEMEAEASAAFAVLPQVRSAVQNGRGKPSLLGRDFGDSGELFDTTPTGKRKLIIDQKSAQERVNRRIAKAMKEAGVRKRMSSQTITPN
jgi:hypothetical protein